MTTTKPITTRINQALRRSPCNLLESPTMTRTVTAQAIRAELERQLPHASRCPGNATQAPLALD